MLVITVTFGIEAIVRYKRTSVIINVRYERTQLYMVLCSIYTPGYNDLFLNKNISKHVWKYKEFVGILKEFMVEYNKCTTKIIYCLSRTVFGE